MICRDARAIACPRNLETLVRRSQILHHALDLILPPETPNPPTSSQTR
ncbi:hypothetical protein [Oscillatoria sp. HE19RPO]|nr:hypothetical protein [Oscillatoria sp. HE19RPO]